MKIQNANENNLFISQLGKLTGRAVNLLALMYFFICAKVSQHLLCRFSRFFFTKLNFYMKGICLNITDPYLFYRFLKGRCHVAKILPFNICKSLLDWQCVE